MVSIKLVLIKLLSFILLVQISFVLGQEFAITEAQRDKNGIIDVTDENFDKVFDLVQSHSFGLFLLFTTNTVEMGCRTCVEFNPEFDLIAKSWKLDHPDFISNTDPDLKFLFGKAVVYSPKNIPDIFKLFRLQHIPALFYFSPGSGLHQFESFDIQHASGPERANQMLKWIKRSTGISDDTDFVIHQQTNWANVFVTCLIVFCSTLLIKKNHNLILKLVRLRWIWGLASVIFILFMISGYMFTKMRQVPLAGADRNGHIIYFAEKDFQNQFGIETQIVALFYGIIGALMIFLIKIIPALDPSNDNTTSSDSFDISNTSIRSNSGHNNSSSGNNNNNNSNSNNNSRTDSVDFSFTKKSKKKNSKGNIHINSPYLVYVLAIVGTILLYSFFAAFTHMYSIKQSYPFTFFKLTSLLGF
ncbi:hypothetical protein RI543_004566 [Arxiozyma heterogenica]|uniref:Thioredoxin domain-containing protein n=1 Tax=Arxiozyma heterogenica TaxID=278026 RepID=A0AAN8A635_9SACH|nr:hypothetical protein RI543_004566 [Kazachstania heterogenica]